MRKGAILLVVAGLAGLLVTLAVAFLGMVQRHSSLAEQVAKEAQARLMLHAACTYVLERSRIGYDDSNFAARHPSEHAEAFGWADVRGSASMASQGVSSGTSAITDTRVLIHTMGPRDQYGDPLWQTGTDGAGNPKWPNIGGVSICHMYRMMRPPYAISLKVSYNPIVADLSLKGRADWGQPLLNHPDPEPFTSTWSAFSNGDLAPVSDSSGVAWFRVRRHSLTRFVVTCGAGGTHGYKNWDEAVSLANETEGMSAVQIFGDQNAFNALLASEVRLWYEIQWTAAVPPIALGVTPAGWASDPANASALTSGVANQYMAPASAHPGGTISYIQRLRKPPPGRGSTTKHPDTGLDWDW
jgi:hypothetical protein